MAQQEGIYRIYCITESNWVSAISDGVLTSCPNNSNHSVNPNSSSQVSSGFTVITSSYTMLDTDLLVNFRGSSLLQTITMPTPGIGNYSLTYNIINTGSIAVAISGVSGVSSLLHNTGIMIISNGTSFVQLV